jgi:DNA repair protein RecN (Recombination protein N)
MLRRLRIRNLAVVEELTWELGKGFNALTGETGAGKSILVDAFLLLLGERADRGLVRTGAEGCLVEGELGGAERFREWLEGKGIEADGEGTLVIQRQVGSTGAGRQFLNGSAVTLAVLKELGDRLVDLHGPHDHQTLLSPAAQRGALDGFGGLEKLVGEVRQAWRAKKESEEAQEAFRKNLMGTDGATREILDHQVKELEEANLVVGEDDQLERDHSAAGHGRRIMELAGELSGILESGDENVLEKLGKVQKSLMEWERLDGAAGELREKNEMVVETLRELVREGERRAEEVGLDRERLAALEARLNCVLSLRKKYGGSVEAALGKLADLKKRQWELANAEGTERELAVAVKKAVEAHRVLAGKLSKERGKAAPLFAREVTGQLRGLGFQQSRLEVAVQKSEALGAEGGEAVEMMFAPNPGEPPRPLRAIASSGELARVMLGIKTVLAERDEVPILIFDEVDANVGGETAKAVAMRLAGLGKTHQVLCLTHLPAVAGAADAHFCVTKTVEKGRTFARLERVEGESREKELSRMLGGEGKAARAMARELMERGKATKV